jgi:DNA-binding response OmpR family regulator
MPSQVPRIVVVEDDASMSQAIERVLQAGGFEAVSFASAEAALEAGAAGADVLVLDIHLPGMSGFELYRRLAQSGEALPAIFITARDEPAVRAESECLGGAGSYLPKPFSGRDLLDAVTRALRCH